MFNTNYINNVFIKLNTQRLRGNEQIDLSRFIIALLSTICEFLLILNTNKEEKMKKTKVEQKNSNDEMMIDLPRGVFGYLGILFIGFAVVDYAASRMGANLTAFLGPLSQFTPIAAGLIGGIFLTMSDKSE